MSDISHILFIIWHIPIYMYSLFTVVAFGIAICRLYYLTYFSLGLIKCFVSGPGTDPITKLAMDMVQKGRVYLKSRPDWCRGQIYVLRYRPTSVLENNLLSRNIRPFEPLLITGPAGVGAPPPRLYMYVEPNTNYTWNYNSLF